MKIIVLLFFIGNALAQNCSHTPKQFSCVKFLKNYDGDTVSFQIPDLHPYFGAHAVVRLKGIDTPELRPKGEALPCETEWARVAKQLVQAELRGAKRIDITNLDRHDKYGRILGQIEYDGKKLTDILLKNRLAVVYEGGRKARTNWCELKKLREQNK